MLLLCDRHLTDDTHGFIVISQKYKMVLFVPLRTVPLRQLESFHVMLSIVIGLLQNGNISEAVPDTHFVLEGELVPQPHVMACKKSTALIRLIKTRNSMAEHVAQHLHFVVPPEGIHGDAIICSSRGSMSFIEAHRLLDAIPDQFYIWGRDF